MTRYLLILLLFFSCNQSEKSISDDPVLPKEPIRYLALGDSYTIGESVMVEERYPIQLATMLTNDSFAVDETKIIAKTGWTTGELQAAINQEKPDSNYQLVSLLIGVNNQYRGNSIDVYAKEFEGLLQQAVAFANGEKEKVFVVSIPDYAYTPFGQNADSEAITKGVSGFNVVNKQITDQYNIAYYNITPISQEGIEKPVLVAQDKLHPSGEQYRIWVESFYEDVRKQLLQ